MWPHKREGRMGVQRVDRAKPSLRGWGATWLTRKNGGNDFPSPKDIRGKKKNVKGGLGNTQDLSENNKRKRDTKGREMVQNARNGTFHNQERRKVAKQTFEGAGGLYT